METGMIGESLRLMLIGMSIVFGFLILLVVLLRGMSWFAERVAPLDLHEGSAAAVSSGAISSSTEDANLIAVIAAAVARYRGQHSG